LFEQGMAVLEGETNVISTSSGWTIQFIAISTICSVSDNIISTNIMCGLFFFKRIGYTSKIGINVKFVQGDDPEEFAKLINDKPKAIYLESMRNSTFNIPDFEAICKIAHDAGIPVIAENTCEYFIKPIEHGADIMLELHSLMLYNLQGKFNPIFFFYPH
ncbi:PLP-dependent transferase, partial [Rhizophagus irregularis]